MKAGDLVYSRHHGRNGIVMLALDSIIVSAITVRTDMNRFYLKEYYLDFQRYNKWSTTPASLISLEKNNEAG